MNTQEIFDTCATHLLTQNRQSSIDTGSNSGDPECRYRGPGGRMCAVGVLISDEFYDSALEGRGMDCESVQRAVCSSVGNERLTPEEIALLKNLQGVHDTKPVEAWPEKLRAVAEYFSLSTEAIDAFTQSGK
jgi:hypothetical protein